jgi:hypothetical protein
MESRRTGITYMQKIKNANCFGHILSRNCHLKYVMEGKIEIRMDWRERDRRGRRRKQLVDDPKEKRGYLKLIEEALD